MKKQVLKFMLHCLRDDFNDFSDSAGLVNLTALAEEAAYRHCPSNEDWLSDPDHWVWEVAIEASDKFERNF